MNTMRIMLRNDVRDRAKQKAEMLGVTLSEIVKTFIAKFADDGIVPFELEPEPEPNSDTREAMNELLSGGGTRCQNLSQMYKNMGIQR